MSVCTRGKGGLNVLLPARKRDEAEREEMQSQLMQVSTVSNVVVHSIIVCCMKYWWRCSSYPFTDAGGWEEEEESGCAHLFSSQQQNTVCDRPTGQH